MTTRFTALALLSLSLFAGCGEKEADDSAADDSAADDSAAPEGMAFSPSADQSLSVDGTVDFTVSGLDDTVAYRVTLVVADNITLGGDGAGTFVDGDANGAADAGASEAVALIAMVNGAAIEPAKTYPGGDDDPSAPSAIFPSGGELSVQLVGVGAGAVHPVVYENGGASTFLELDGSGAPVEVYLVGPAVAVQ
ncbi:MAG: hypothetical protein H6741_10520 [Alphaproteobacteria bacterium]|nr:hypothetical protein [Alphaproteobacteria bacterium]